MTQRAELIVSGRIATLSGESSWGWESGVAVAAGHVLAVGGRSELESLASGSTKRLLVPDGYVAMPGITDAHLHLMELVLGEAHIDLNGMNLPAALAAIAAEDQQRRMAGDDEGWLLGHGWSMHDLGGWPTAEMLERVAPGRPVALYAHDHHSRWVSQTAIRLADIDSGRGESFGDLVRTDESGRPTGVLHEAAGSLPDAVIPDPSRDMLIDWLNMVARRLAAMGVTGCHDPGLLNADPLMQRGPLFYRDLAEEGRLPLRVAASIRSSQIEHAREIGWRSGQSVGRYSSGWLKLFADGSLGSRSAALLEPYLDRDINPPTGGPCGMVVTDADELIELLRQAADGGVVGQVHAIGDAAVRMVLDVFAETPAIDSPLMRRIEHAQLVDPIDQPRFGALAVAASVQPVHLRSDAIQEREAWGIRADESFPLRTLLAGGALIPFGTDAPVEPADPWPGIAVATCRRDPFDADAAPVGADHAITLERAIRAACVDPALVAGRHDLGRLVPGALADLIVVPDIVANEEADPAELAAVRPLATFIDGELVHGGW
ncbi:MAG TPA: amidohydrolase [Candidatus Limnocylindrales bacterium]